MRALVTGARGQLGCELMKTLSAMGNEAGEAPKAWEDAQIDAVDYDELDIANATAVNDWFASHGPYDVVFNCAAFTNVDGCETHESEAFAVNALGPENLAHACAPSGSVLVHVSTDYVFSGKQPGARKEEDECAPVSAYGRTKLEGERRALAANPRTHVVRTAWLYGHNGGNFVRTMMRLGVSHDEIMVVDDQVGNPTNAADLALAMLRIALSDSFGVWHATNEGECSWADFAEAIMADASLDCRIARCTSSQWKAMNPSSAARPAYSSLANGHLEDTIGNDMRPWREALASFMAAENASREDTEESICD